MQSMVLERNKQLNALHQIQAARQGMLFTQSYMQSLILLGAAMPFLLPPPQSFQQPHFRPSLGRRPLSNEHTSLLITERPKFNFLPLQLL